MFNKIGEKIQIIAELFFGLVILGSIILAIFCWVNEFVELGFLIIMAGPLLAYMFALFIAGFGKIIEKTEETSDTTTKILDCIVKKNNEVARKLEIIEEKVIVGKKVEEPMLIEKETSLAKD